MLSSEFPVGVDNARSGLGNDRAKTASEKNSVL